MKALTVRQPWAALIFQPRPCDCLGYQLGLACVDPQRHPTYKTIETRSRKAPGALIGQRVAIHAGFSATKLRPLWSLLFLDGVCS